MRIKIDKGIPAPKPGTNCYEKYPFSKLEIGDSFLIPDSVDIRTARVNVYRATKRLNIKLTARKVDGGYRVWRIENSE